LKQAQWLKTKGDYGFVEAVLDMLSADRFVLKWSQQVFQQQYGEDDSMRIPLTALSSCGIEKWAGRSERCS